MAWPARPWCEGSVVTAIVPVGPALVYPLPVNLSATGSLGKYSYVLHAFQKKSKSGIKTPAEEIDKIKTRLREAEKHHAQWAEEARRKSQGRH
jgi:hypothetical protein